jgi:molybdopterin converting factor small subunit
MPVTFHIPGALREFADGRSTVEIEQSPVTLADALSALWQLYPGIRARMATEQGEIREHINVFLGEENMRYTGGLATAIPDGCEISIVPAISGGSEFRDVMEKCADHCRKVTNSISPCANRSRLFRS